MNSRPTRHTPRAPWHRYDDATYFITICTSNRAHSFGIIRNGEVHLSALGECLRREIEDIQTHYPYAEIPLYVIMPNHVHLIVAIDSAKDGNIYDMDAMNRVRTEQTAENLNTTNNELDNCNNHRETAYNAQHNADVRTRFIASHGENCNMDAMNRVHTEHTAKKEKAGNDELNDCNNHRETAYNAQHNTDVRTRFIASQGDICDNHRETAYNAQHNADVRTRFIASQGDDCDMDAMTRVRTKRGGATGDKNPMLSKTLGTVVRGLKARVSHYAKQNGIEFAWHGRYHDHIIRNNTDMNNIANYIINNPANWKTDCFYGNN